MGDGISLHFSLVPMFDDFYKNGNEIKSNFDENKLLLLCRILIHHSYMVF